MKLAKNYCVVNCILSILSVVNHDLKLATFIFATSADIHILI